MKRVQIKEILEKEYSEHMVSSILNGRRRPNANKRYIYEKEYGIPFTAWGDIKSYIESYEEKEDEKDESCTQKGMLC